ncbi:MAG: DUF1707 domain-containing protein [Streptosporangiaceae bacterium]|jgi:hypothetical protein
MTADPRIRASDEDRDRAATLLREHHAVGRLTAEEFSERLDKVYAARTMGDLDELLADLPGIDLHRLPDAALPRYRPPAAGHGSLPSLWTQGQVTHAGGRFSPGWAAAWGSWLSASLVLIVIWALAGAGYPWFLWAVGPWGALMLADWISGGHHGGRGHGSRRHPDQLEGGPHDG